MTDSKGMERSTDRNLSANGLDPNGPKPVWAIVPTVKQVEAMRLASLRRQGYRF